MVKFKSHKFISKEELSVNLFNRKWKDVGIGLQDITVIQNKFVKTGHAQYTVIDMEDRNIIIKTLSENEKEGGSNITTHYPNVKLDEIWKVEGFNYLKDYIEKGKIKLIYKLISTTTGEVVNEEVVPAYGNYEALFIGLLIK